MKEKILNKRYIVIVILLLVLAIIISVLLNNNIFIEPSQTMPTQDELNLVYSEIIEQNKIKLANPVEYGDEYCSGYVSTQNDVEIHRSILSDLQVLSDTVCAGCENDYDKVKAITYYVAENIYYNHIAAEECVTADTISLENVLSTKTATCAGYSNLFSALCNMQGIYCVNLRGGTHVKDCFSAVNLLNIPINHEWNAVLIDNEWMFVDTTWISNNGFTENGYEKANDFDDQYFDMSLEEMSYEHRIDIIDYRNFKSSINAFT